MCIGAPAPHTSARQTHRPIGMWGPEPMRIIARAGTTEPNRATQGHPLLASLLAVWLATLVHPAPGSTEEPLPEVSQTLELMKEEEIVSVASRYEQPISEAPSNVYVITDEDIRQSGATDLPTVLRRIPGMEVMQTTGADFNVSVRGDNQLQANKLLVNVDGRSIYIDAQGVVFWKAIPVTLPEIKRIEVLKGPASAVYGFNAFDGIINIITKSAEEMRGTTVQFGGGELGTISSAAVHAGTSGRLGYRVSLGRDQNQQWRDREALAFRANKFNVQTEYALSDVSNLTVSGGLVDVNRFDGPPVEISVNAATPAMGYANIGYQRPNFFIRAWWNSFSSTTEVVPFASLNNLVRATDRNGSSTLTNPNNTYNVEIQHSFEFGPANRLTYGSNYRHNTASSNFLTSFTREDRLGLYVQDEWRAMENLTVIAGVRYDLDTFINPTVSPRVAVLYKVARDHTVRAAMSVAYRPPTMFETNINAQTVTTLPPPIPSQPPTPTLGSQNLEAERIVSYDVGYQGWFYNHRVRVRSDLFFNHISDLINFRNVPETGTTTVNGGVADIYGGEAGIEVLASRWLSGFANFSYQEIGQNLIGTAQRGAPRFKSNAGIRVEWENGLSGEAAYHYYGAAAYPISPAFAAFAPLGVVPPNTRVGSYNLLNLRAGYRFWQQKAAAGYMRDAEVAVSVFNALNDKHKEHPLGDTIGSRTMGWLTVRY